MPRIRRTSSRQRKLGRWRSAPACGIRADRVMEERQSDNDRWSIYRNQGTTRRHSRPRGEGHESRCTANRPASGVDVWEHFRDTSSGRYQRNREGERAATAKVIALPQKSLPQRSTESSNRFLLIFELFVPLCLHIARLGGFNN